MSIKSKAKPDLLEPLGRVAYEARAIAESFTGPDGEMIEDTLSRSEWERLRSALRFLDDTIASGQEINDA